MRLRASVALLALAASTVFAQSTASKTRTELKAQTVRGPVKITAERADLDRRQYALYRGNVRLTSAELELSGDRLELRQPVKGEFTAHLSGSPAHLRHEGLADEPPIQASAQLIDYDTRTAMVVMSGGAEIVRGSDHMSSESIRYNVAARRINAAGVGGGRVQMIVQPPPPRAQEKKPEVPQNTPPPHPPTPSSHSRPPR